MRKMVFIIRNMNCKTQWNMKLQSYKYRIWNCLKRQHETAQEWDPGFKNQEEKQKQWTTDNFRSEQDNKV